jgi:hypothetical protein
MIVPILIAIAVAIMVVSIIAISQYVERRRRDAMRVSAERMNLSFSENDDQSLRQRLSRFHLFSQGRSRRIRNVMRGRVADLDIAIFDYRYRTGGGNSSRTWRQTVLHFDVQRMKLPPFSLRPEHFFHRLGQVFGYQDVDFDTHPTFSSKYLLRGAHEDEIRSVFSDQLLTHLETQTGLSTEAAGGDLIYYRANRRVDPERIGEFIKDGVQILAMLRTQET